MSLLYMESFFAFGEYNGPDTYGAQVVADRNAHAANLMRAGYGVMMPANTSADTSGGFFIRVDPLYPTSRKALTHSSDVGATVSAGVTAALKKKLPITDRQIIFGFGVYIPANYVANVNASTVPVLRVNATVDSDTGWQEDGTAAATPRECFRVCDDLSIRWGTETPQSGRKLKAGAMNYMEVRISSAEVSVWIDDVFVLQKSIALIPQCIAFAFENNVNVGAGGTNMSGTPGRWALEHMYFLNVDDLSPNVRLGPSTRAIASRAETDIDVRFIRPTTAPTNASVAAQDIVDAPAQQLQSTVIGDFDTYASTQNNDDIKTMGMVHAVATKVLASNLEPDRHYIRPYQKFNNGAEAADVKAKELQTIVSPTTRTIRAMTVRPGDKSIWMVGDGQSVWRSGANGDISTWTKVREVGDAVSYNCIYADPDGSMLIGGSTGRVYAISRLSNVIDSDTLTAAGGVVSTIVKSPDGTRYYAARGPGSAGSPWAYYSTNPYSASATWNNVSGGAVTPPSSNNGGSSTSAADSTGRTVVLAGSANDSVFVSLLANGTSYSVRPHGDAALVYNAITWDGLQFLIAETVYDAAIGGAPHIRRSSDTITWSLPTPIGSRLPGANAQLRFGASNTTTHESIFGGDQGALALSLDAINWRQLPRLTDNALYAGVAMPDGGFLIGGAGGVMLRLFSQGADTVLIPLAGYTMAIGSSVINPATGAIWTPAEAADAQFGVRLTS